MGARVRMAFGRRNRHGRPRSGGGIIRIRNHQSLSLVGRRLGPFSEKHNGDTAFSLKPLNRMGGDFVAMVVALEIILSVVVLVAVFTPGRLGGGLVFRHRVGRMGESL